MVFLIIAAAVLVCFFGFTWAGGIVAVALGFVILVLFGSIDWSGENARFRREQQERYEQYEKQQEERMKKDQEQIEKWNEEVRKYQAGDPIAVLRHNLSSPFSRRYYDEYPFERECDIKRLAELEALETEDIA